MQGTQPRHALPSIQDPVPVGKPKRYLKEGLAYFAVKMSPDGAHLGDEEGHEEGGKGGKQQGAGEGAQIWNPKCA